MKSVVAAFILAAVSLSACAPIQGDASDMLPGPKPLNAEAQVKTAIKALLKDPYTARFESVEPPSVFTCGGVFSHQWRTWMAQATVNARNSFGGYTGAETYYVFFKDGRVDAVQDGFALCPQE
jgi:hypothetical protein